MCSAIAGCARASRLARIFSDPHHQAIWNVGCNVAGPLLFAYTLWVLARARRLGIERMYFLARDGEALLQIARQICRWLGWSIDCRYLYSSRQSLSLPALTEFDESTEDWLLKWWEIPAVRIILSNVSDERLKRSDWDRALTRQDLKRLHGILKDIGVDQQILAIARERREVLIDYLLQEGLADRLKWAVCDCGWRGSTQLYLARVMATRPEFPKEIKGFYFGLNRKDLCVPLEQTETFYAGDSGFVSKFGWLVEGFCWNEEASVEYFARDASGTAAPKLAKQDLHQIKWGSGVQRAAIMHFVDNLMRTLSVDETSVDQFMNVIGQKAMAAFELMRTRPSLEEADAYGSSLMDYDVGHTRQFVAGPALRPDHLLLSLALRHRSGVARYWWPEGAIRRSVRFAPVRGIFHSVHHARVLWDRFRGRVAS